MKLRDITDIATEADGHTKEYGMSIDDKDQGLIFEFLRSKIYKRPIDAICREIMSNSRDANREVGKEDKPIIVGIRQGGSLIDGSSMSIYFKDEGPGISPERMANVFCKYAASTKRDTNFQTGGFGLGAKTPFSYTDIFSVETSVDGIMYTYTAYIDETKKGKIILQNEEPTEEPNGTAIVVPLITDSDRYKFERACRFYSMFWSIDPIFENFESEEYEYNVVTHETYNGITFTVIESEDDAFSRGNTLLIDGVPYEVEVDQFDYSNIGSKINYKYVMLVQFDNGDLDVAISREGLQYTDNTKDKLTHAYDTIKQCLHNQFEVYVDQADNYFDATLLNYGLHNPDSSIAIKMRDQYEESELMNYAYKWLKKLNVDFEITFEGRKLHTKIDQTYVQHQIFVTSSMDDIYTTRVQDISLTDLFNSKEKMYYIGPGKAINKKKTYAIFDQVQPDAHGNLSFGLIRIKSFSQNKRNYHYYSDQEKLDFIDESHKYIETLTDDFSNIIKNYTDVKPLKEIRVAQTYAKDQLVSVKARLINENSYWGDASIILYYSKQTKKFYNSNENEINVCFVQVHSYAEYHIPSTTRNQATLINKFKGNIRCVILNSKAERYTDNLLSIEDTFNQIDDIVFERIRVAKSVFKIGRDIFNSSYLNFDFNCYGFRSHVETVYTKYKKIKNNKTLVALIEKDCTNVLMDGWKQPEILNQVATEINSINKLYPVAAELYLTNDSIRENKNNIKDHINNYINKINESKKYSNINTLKID